MRSTNRRAWRCFNRWIATSAAVLIIGATANLAHAQAAAFHTEDIVNNTGTSQSTMTVVLAGDQTANIASSFSNPFTADPHTAPSVSFDGTNTLLTFSGPNAIAPGGSAHYGFGFAGNVSESNGFGEAPVREAYWDSTPSSADDTPAPTIDVSVAAPSSGPVSYLIINSDINLVDAPDGEWSELQVPVGTFVTAELANNDNADGPMFAFKVGFFLSDTMIPLDDLNNTYEPPMGQMGSMFNPLPGIPDGTEIDPGGHVESGMIEEPEPTCCLWIVAGLAILRRRMR